MSALLLHSALLLGFLPTASRISINSLLQARSAARSREIRLDYTNRETPSKPGVGDRWVTDGHKSRVSDPAADGPSVISLARRAACSTSRAESTPSARAGLKARAAASRCASTALGALP